MTVDDVGMVLHAQPADQPADAGPDEAFESAPATPVAAIEFTSPGPLAASGSLRNPFPPIADYAFLSDWETTCLISPAGSVEWLCVPRPDSPSVFGAILDRDAGRFRFGPENFKEPADRRYLPGTMVVETSWDCAEGWIVVRDCLLMGPWRHEHPGRSSHTRPPTDYDAEHTLLRTVRCVHGNAQLVMDCEPVFDYGRVRCNWRHTERGYNQAELIARPLARRLGLKLGAYLLVRTKPRPAQLILSRSEHWKSVRGAYATRQGVRVDKLRVLLVDDVLTTGATLDACSRVLKKAGAAKVYGLTVARVVPGSSLTASRQRTKLQSP